MEKHLIKNISITKGDFEDKNYQANWKAIPYAVTTYTVESESFSLPNQQKKVDKAKKLSYYGGKSSEYA